MTVSTPVALPVRIDPSHWIECLDGMANEATLQRWAAQPRFRQRLIERLRRRHALADLDELPPRDPTDSALCELDADTLALAIRAAGVIVHANAVTREIQAPRVAALRQRLGSDLYALALAHGDIERDSLPHIDAAVGDDLDAFDTRIEQEGQRCLLAWAQRQPAPLKAWLQLGWLGRLRADVPPPAATEPGNGDALDDADARDEAGEIARLAATYVLSRAAPSRPAERQGDDS